MRFKWRKKRVKKAPLGNRRQKIRKLKLIAIAVVSVVLIILLGWSLRLEQFQVSNILISGNKVIPQEKIQSIVEDNLSGTYFFLSPKTNIFFYPKSRITKQIEDEFERVKEVSVNFVNLKSIEVKILERTPKSMWCGVKKESAVGGCYFMDENGYIYAKAPDFGGNVFLKFFGLDYNSLLLGSESPIGVTIMDVEKFDKFTLFVDTLSEIGYKPISLARVDDHDFELYFNDGMKIIFGNDQDFEILLDNLQSVLDSGELVNRENIDYIDLRFGNKVYYKFKNEGNLE